MGGGQSSKSRSAPWSVDIDQKEQQDGTEMKIMGGGGGTEKERRKKKKMAMTDQVDLS